MSEKRVLQMTREEERVVAVLDIACLPMEIDDDIAVLLRMCGPFGSVMQAHLLNYHNHNHDDTADVNMAVTDGLTKEQGGHLVVVCGQASGECSLGRARVHMRGVRNAMRCAAALDGLVLFEGASPLKVTVLS